jgi:hypothetical protein
MNPPLVSLAEQRDQVLNQMRAIDRLRRGTLSRHFLRRRRDGKTVTHGPYFVLQGYLRGRKFSRHIPAAQAERVAAEVRGYQQFQTLADRFVALTDQMTQQAEATADSKKNSSRKRSPTSASAKPRPS